MFKVSGRVMAVLRKRGEQDLVVSEKLGFDFIHVVFHLLIGKA